MRRRYVFGGVLILAAVSVDAMAFLMLAYFQETSLVIDIPGPEIEVALNGTAIAITGPRREKVVVQPGQQELRIRHTNVETVTAHFMIRRGESRAVTVSIVDKKIAATVVSSAAILTSW
jgi:hypothetical protein